MTRMVRNMAPIAPFSGVEDNHAFLCLDCKIRGTKNSPMGNKDIPTSHAGIKDFMALWITLILEPHAYYAKLKGLMPWHPKRWIVTATYEWQAELSAFLIFQYFWDQSFRALHQTLSAISIQLEKILEFWRLLTPGNLIWKLGLEHPTYK